LLQSPAADVRARGRVDQLNVDADLIFAGGHAAFDQRSHAQGARDAIDGYARIPIRFDTVSGDHLEHIDLAELLDQPFRHTGRVELERAALAQVVEVEDRHSPWVEVGGARQSGGLTPGRHGVRTAEPP
jgi:hypothetical protein